MAARLIDVLLKIAVAFRKKKKKERTIVQKGQSLILKQCLCFRINFIFF